MTTETDKVQRKLLLLRAILSGTEDEVVGTTNLYGEARSELTADLDKLVKGACPSLTDEQRDAIVNELVRREMLYGECSAIDFARYHWYRGHVLKITLFVALLWFAGAVGVYWREARFSSHLFAGLITIAQLGVAFLVVEGIRPKPRRCDLGQRRWVDLGAMYASGVAAGLLCWWVVARWL